jgi:hypothetical protein
MYLFCVQELRMSEDMACKRICAARAARRFPAIFEAVAEGRLHLSAVVTLAPHLTPETAGGLLAAAAHQTRVGIELLLAERFPKPDVPTILRPVAPVAVAIEPGAGTDTSPTLSSAPGRIIPAVAPTPPLQVERPAAAPLRSAKPMPLSPGRFALQVTLDQATLEQLRHAQALLGHAVPSGDIAEVLKRALDALVEKLEKRKFARSDRPGPARGSANSRCIPAHVRRAVWKRDGGRCTFESDKGKRCESRTRLELDHVEPVARGGQATVSGIRLRCRAHNQYAAERTFGSEFMRAKREQGRDEPARANGLARASARSLAISAGSPHPAAAPPPGERPRT